MKNLSRSLLIAALGPWLVSPVLSQTATFNFDTNAPPLGVYTNLPFDQTSGGVTAHFSAPVGGFSVQNASTMGGLVLSRFSGKFLVPPNGTWSVLEIQFSRKMTNMTFDFATIQSQPIEIETPVQLNAYLDSLGAPVGSATVAGVYGSDTWPMGRLAFGSAAPFNLVRIKVTNVFPTPQASDFVIDNIAVSLAPPPATNVAPVLAAISNRTVTAGTPISFTATAADDNWPAQTLMFALAPGCPAGTCITTNGSFSWTPCQAHAVSSNCLTVTVTDNGTPPLSDSKSFSVVVDGVRLQSSATPGGFTDETNAVVSLVQSNIMVTSTQTTCFYRLQAFRPSTISRTRIAGGQATLGFCF